MAIELIDLGIAGDNSTGDGIREGGEKINNNFTELDTEVVRSVVSSEPVGSDKITNIVSLTQQEYDAGTKIPTTLYLIK